MLIYSVYALIYQTHKSWYSWVVNSLVGAVYMFGFIRMCPQLYLNYKLKSVAHMPWCQMTYKFLVRPSTAAPPLLDTHHPDALRIIPIIRMLCGS